MHSLNRIISFHPEKILFYYACLCSFLIVIFGASIFKYSLFGLSLFSILLIYSKTNWSNLTKEIKTHILPWVPWIICVLILIIVHGTRGLTQYINAFLLITLLFFGCFKCDIVRKTLIIFLGLGLILLDASISIYVLKFGLVDNILGVNKNELMAVVSFITISIACTLFTQSKEYKRLN